MSTDTQHPSGLVRCVFRVVCVLDLWVSYVMLAVGSAHEHGHPTPQRIGAVCISCCVCAGFMGALCDAGGRFCS
jgi:hypothetical protein